MLWWIRWKLRLGKPRHVSYKSVPSLGGIWAPICHMVPWAMQVYYKLQTVCWILAASKGWIKQTYWKIMHTQNTQNHITGNDLVQIE